MFMPHERNVESHCLFCLKAWHFVCLTSVWKRNQPDVTLCYPLFLLYKLLNMFRATMCPSSGADDCEVLLPRVGIVPWLQEGCQLSAPEDGHMVARNILSKL